MSEGETFVMLALVVVVIVLLMKLSALKSQVASKANEEARMLLARWKGVEMGRELARQVELSTAAIKEKAANDVRLAKEEARLDFQKWKADETIKIRRDASTRSTSVHIGKATEHLIPWFLDGAFDSRDIRFIGSPIDLIVFNGLTAGYVESIHFIEVKSGRRAILSPREELVRGAVASGRISYSIAHLEAQDEAGGNNLKWIGDQPSFVSYFMNKEIHDLMEKHTEAMANVEFEEASELQKRVFNIFQRSIAHIADEVAILKEEVERMQKNSRSS